MDVGSAGLWASAEQQGQGARKGVQEGGEYTQSQRKGGVGQKCFVFFFFFFNTGANTFTLRFVK